MSTQFKIIRQKPWCWLWRALAPPNTVLSQSSYNSLNYDDLDRGGSPQPPHLCFFSVTLRFESTNRSVGFGLPNTWSAAAGTELAASSNVTWLLMGSCGCLVEIRDRGSWWWWAGHGSSPHVNAVLWSHLELSSTSEACSKEPGNVKEAAQKLCRSTATWMTLWLTNHDCTEYMCRCIYSHPLDYQELCL